MIDVAMHARDPSADAAGDHGRLPLAAHDQHRPTAQLTSAREAHMLIEALRALV